MYGDSKLMALNYDLNEPNEGDAIKILAPDNTGIQIQRDNDGNAVHTNWSDGNPHGITEQQIADKMAELRAIYKANKYQRDRKLEYDQLNQFELIGEDAINGTTNHKDAILEIKARFPKP